MAKIADQLARIFKKKRTVEEEEETVNSSHKNSPSGNPYVVIEWTSNQPLDSLRHVGTVAKTGQILKRSTSQKPSKGVVVRSPIGGVFVRDL